MARLGAPGELGLHPVELQALQIQDSTLLIDVSAAEDAASGNGHGYFIKSPWVSNDLLLSLITDAHPSERGLAEKEGGVVWGFPEYYPQKIEDVVKVKRLLRHDD